MKRANTPALLKTTIWDALRAAAGNVQVAARALKITPRELLQQLNAHPIGSSSMSGTRARVELDDDDQPAWGEDSNGGAID